MNNAPKGIISEDQMVPIEQVVAELVISVVLRRALHGNSSARHCA